MADELQVGAEVVTADGRKLGRVKKLEGNAFLVNAPRQLDYWLETTLVKESSAGRAELTIDQGEIGAYKMDNPNDHNAFQERSQDERDMAARRAESLAKARHTRH